MERFYIQGNDGNEYGPVDSETLRAWIKEGRANAMTQVRTESGTWRRLQDYADFKKMVGAPIVTPPPFQVDSLQQSTSENEAPEIRQAKEEVLLLINPIAKADPWLRLISVFHFFQAGLLIATLYGIPVAWIPVWLGVTLWQLANSAQNAMRTGNQYSVTATIRKTRRYFILMGITAIICITLTIVAIFVSVVRDDVDIWKWFN